MFYVTVIWCLLDNDQSNRKIKVEKRKVK